MFTRFLAIVIRFLDHCCPWSRSITYCLAQSHTGHDIPAIERGAYCFWKLSSSVKLLTDMKEVALGSEKVENNAEEYLKCDGQQKPSNTRVVFVWDLDETLIVFQSLLTGKFISESPFHRDEADGKRIGDAWSDLILDISDSKMFFKQIDDCDQPHIRAMTKWDDGAELDSYDFEKDNVGRDHMSVDDLTPVWRRELAYRYRAMEKIYSEGAEKMMSKEQLSKWEALYKETDEFTNGWLSAGQHILRECHERVIMQGCLSAANDCESKRCNNSKDLSHDDEGKPISFKRAKIESGVTGRSKEGQEGEMSEDESTLKGARERNDGSVQSVARVGNGTKNGRQVECVNTIVTSGQLIPTLTKLMLFKLSHLVDPRAVYSSRSTCKLTGFQWIEGTQGNNRKLSNPTRVEKAPVFQKLKFLAIGDGPDEEEAAQILRWPFVLVAKDESSRIQSLTLDKLLERVF